MKAAASVALLLLSATSQQALAQQAATPQQTAPAPQQGTKPALIPGSPAPKPGQTDPATQAAPQTSGSPTNPTAPAAPQAVQNDTTGTPGLPQAPQPKLTEPLYLRDTPKDYTQLKRHDFRHLSGPFAPYTATDFELPRLSNTPQLYDLLRDGKLYLSLSDAVTLALENNYDIAIARINLDIADTDILRTRSGAIFRGVNTGLVTNTLGGSTSTITGGGGPGGTTTASGGAGAGASGIVLSTNGGGPLPFNYDPLITGNIQYENQTTEEASNFLTGTNQLKNVTELYNFGYTQGFSSGSQLAVTYDNTRQTTTSPRSSYSPLLQPTVRFQFTQHLLQGFGPSLNKRFITEAINNRRITDSSFRQQLLYTIAQVESIYWNLVSGYEDEQAKERALSQSTQLTADNRKQLQIGTLAPLDVITSDSAVATDRQALTTSRSNLEYQQLLMKQAISRNLNDPQLTAAPVVPTDRVSLERLPEEDLQVEDLVKMAFLNNPAIEQAAINEENNKITIKGEKNGLLPIVDVYGFYGSATLGGQQNPALVCTDASFATVPCSVATGGVNNSNYFDALGKLFNGTAPDYGVGLNLQIPLRNRLAQADQARSQMELRQSQMRLQQLYTQIRIQVINQQYALTNDRANVEAAQVARDFNAQSLDAEQKKYKLGASTTANVLTQERTLATGEDNLISAQAAYAKDRSLLNQLLSDTLDRYSISLVDAASGKVLQKPAIPGLTPPKAPAPPKPLTTDLPPAPAQ